MNAILTLILLASSGSVLSRYTGNCGNNACSNSCQNCNNACSGDTCCKTEVCNTCVTQCSDRCETNTCRNNCIHGCSNTCQVRNCAEKQCSNCVSNCSNDCSSPRCVEKCSSDCCERPPAPEPITIHEKERIPNIIVNHTSNNLVNLTTHINLNNVINNFNNISAPVSVNTTNLYNIDLSLQHASNQTPSVVPSERVIVPVYPQYPPQYQNNCCMVMHPRECYTDESGNRRCIVRRHRECGDMCTSQVVQLEQNQVAPQNCHYIQNYPYSYCGNYDVLNCGNCYHCDGAYNPGVCSQRNECAQPCRMNMPNCVPYRAGVYCL